MLLFLLDTDHLTLLEHGHPPLKRHLHAQPHGSVGLAAVTVAESLRGRLATIGRARDSATRLAGWSLFLDSLHIFQQFPLVPFDQAAENRVQHLLSLRLRIGTQDTLIASVALANNVVLFTSYRRDFSRFPGLRIDDWSV
jgi:tRNA(fMet)-specific endonuclease VapC